jgi:glycolate oxidase iron-sulfur subunit
MSTLPPVEPAWFGGGSAFDARRPPDPSLIEACVHCGFCLPTCPTYALWGEEMDSPRGRLVLMQRGLEGGSDMSRMSIHFDRCLGCMACVTACPSGVRYDLLIEATRPQVERNARRPRGERVFRRALFALVTHPRRLRLLAPLLALHRGLGISSLVRRSGALRRAPRLRALERLAPLTPPARQVPALPGRVRARGSPRGRVGLLLGCVQRVLFSQVNAATARVLAAEGFDVEAPARPRCCGALQLHTGFEPEAIDRAKDTIAALDGYDLIAVNAAGCGSAMKGYAHLLRDETGWAERATRFSAKVRDVAELLAEVEPLATRHPLPIRVAYHDACHLAHAQGIRAEPRALLSAIPELQLVEPAEWEICCGSAGVYNILQPDAAFDLGRRKAERLLATEADVIAAGNPGCVLQIAAHLRELGRPLPVYHPIEILDRSIGRGG